MDKASTDWRIQSQPAKLLTLSGLAANWANSASIAACLAKSWPYTLPSTLLRRYSNTRSAGFNSGEYGGCSINLTGTSLYTSPRWPRARSQTKTVNPSKAHCLTTGAIEVPRIFPVQSQRNWAAQPIDRQVQICPLSLILDRLDDLHPAGCPHPTNLSNQPHPHFIAPGQASRVRAANFLELVG